VGFEVGQRVADYEIVSLLGVGGMSRVYGVRNVISHRNEAMKVLLADLSAEPDLAARFAGEIRTLAALDHPNIAQLHTALQVGNELVMMMEFVDGFTLQQLSKRAPLPLEVVVDYLHQVLAALSFAHNRGVVHRDIKPANIMVTPHGIAKLTDFGIAKSKIENELTIPGTTVGSLYYMSPEQARGGCTIDGRSDLYSLGITMYELLAGRRPFEDESYYAILHSQLTVVPRPPIDVNPLLSKSISDLILKALAKDPARRFQNAAAFSDALRQVTGIAPSTPIESGVEAPATAAIPSGCVRNVVAATDKTSRFSTDAHRRWWKTAEALAVLVVFGFGAFGFPRFLKTVATAKTIGHATATQSPSFPVVPHDGNAAPNTEQPTVITPGLIEVPQNDPAPPPDSAEIPADDPVPAPAAVSAPPQAPTTAAFTKQRVRPAGARLSPVGYQPVSLPNPMAEAEEQVRPSLSASTLAEVQQVRNQTMDLDARAAAARIKVKRLKSEREAAGASLSLEVAGAYVRMNAYLSAEKADLDDGDVAAARDHMEKARAEVNGLESLFNR
jgi:eukaryotic-like serine/threonine-protein kinase